VTIKAHQGATASAGQSANSAWSGYEKGTIIMTRITSFIAIAFLILNGPALAQKSNGTSLQTYQIQTGSDIHVLVYRAGALGKLGHNHVVSVAGPKGTIRYAPGARGSSVELTVPVRALIVDNPALRRAEGKDFSSQPSKSDISGTRANMLSKKLLNAARFPTIAIKGTLAPGATSAGATLNVSVKILGRTRNVSLPVRLKLSGNVLEASGSRRLTHGQLGLKPFSALFGALKVADRMDLKYRIRAKRVGN